MCKQYSRLLLRVVVSIVVVAVTILMAGCTEAQLADETGLATPTSGPCRVSLIPYTNIYAGPGTYYGIVGQIEANQDYLVTGMFYVSNSPTWWRIGYGGAEGWVDGSDAVTNFMPGQSCNPPVDLVDINPPPPTTIALTAIPDPCTVQTGVGTGTVRSGPGANYLVLGQLDPERKYQVTGMYYAPDYPTWWRIDFDGSTGWVDAGDVGSSFMPGYVCNPPVDLVDVNPPDIYTPTATLSPGN